MFRMIVLKQFAIFQLEADAFSSIPKCEVWEQDCVQENKDLAFALRFFPPSFWVGIAVLLCGPRCCQGPLHRLVYLFCRWASTVPSDWSWLLPGS